ncbi:MAG: peptidylprolyl isomerase [Campylobacter sp.]|nr:peptidylprolyl isomerase [Campylobacter sp.]
MNKILFGALSLVAALSLNAQVFAVVDGENITEREVAPLLQGIPAGFDINQLPIDAKKDLIDKSIQFHLLTKHAKASGIENNATYKEEVEIAKDNIALRVWQLGEFAKTKVSDAEIKKFYDENKANFVEPAQIHAKHILVKDEKEAKDIIAKLSKVKKEGLDGNFTAIAKEKSIEPAAKQSGGDLGWFAPEQMVKPFSDAVVALKKGEISKTPVKSDFGYHVIYKVDNKDKKQLTLDETKKYIENVLKEEKYKANIQKIADDLVKKSKVEYR